MRQALRARLDVVRVSDAPRHQTARFVIAGSTVAATYLGLTLLLSGPGGVAIQIAIPIAYVTSVCLHFALQRWFVFAREAFALPMRQQVLRYIPMGGAQYAFTATMTAVLPGVLDLPEQAVYVAAALVASAATFLFLRGSVFHAVAQEGAAGEGPATNRLRLPAGTAWFLLCGAVLAYYLWSAGWIYSPLDLSSPDGDGGGYYGLLTDAFLHGQVHLRVDPQPELLALSNPYDPAANQRFRMHDLSLYEGKYFLQWGPTPVLTLFLPWRLLPLGDLNEALAVAIFAFTGFVFSVLLLRTLVRRFVPHTPGWMVGLAALTLAFANVAPFLLRRPAVYEVALSCALCFAMATLWLAASSVLRAQPSRRRLALASLCLGLTLGARPTLGLLGVFLAAAAWFVARRLGRRDRLRWAAAAFGPVLAVGFVLLGYNAIRYGALGEFGQSYQLAGVDVTQRGHGKLEWLAPGLFHYLLAAPQITLAFPYIHLPAAEALPWTPPAGYDGVELTGGLFWLVPLVIMVPIAAVRMLRRRDPEDRGLLAIGALSVGCGLAVVTMLSLAVWGTTQRYETDFAMLFAIPALLAWFRLGTGRNRAMRLAGVVLVAWSILAGAAIAVTGYFDRLPGPMPSRLRSAEQTFEPLTALAARVRGVTAVLAVTAPAGYSGDIDAGPRTIGPTFSVSPAMAATVQIVSARDQTVRLRAVFAPLAPGARFAVTATSGRRGEIARIITEGGPADLVVPLRWGLNDVIFRVAPVSGPHEANTSVQVQALKVIA